MADFLKFLPCLFLGFFVSCSLFVAGTTEETNALAGQDKEDLSSSSLEKTLSSSSLVQSLSSSSAPKSSSSSMVVAPSSSDVPFEPPSGLLQSRYWHPYWAKAEDEYMVNMRVDAEEGDELSISYQVSQPLGSGSSAHVSPFGIEVLVDGEGSDVFSEMKTWTGGACYMLTSEVPIILEMGMSPEKEKELEYDLPRATLIGTSDVGNMVIRCVSWTDFEQQGTGPAITIEEAFFDYMTSLRFVVQPDESTYEGSFEIYQIRKGGTGIDANIDGTEVNFKDGE